MHSHPSLDEPSLDRIGVWEDAGDVVGVAHYESRLGEAFFQVHPDCGHLKPGMLQYAERHFCAQTEGGGSYVRAYVNDFDCEFESLVRSRGYELMERHARPVSEFTIPRPFPRIDLPEGFRLKSLADESNLRKMHRLLWRGFNREGEPPEQGIEGRRKQQTGPNYKKDGSSSSECRASGGRGS
jgi:hypothetical protein